MSGLMDAIRHAFGIERRRVPATQYPEIEARLRDQAARLKAMDAQVDAQRTSTTILDKRRRVTDR